MDWLKTILSDYSLSRVKKALDDESLRANDIPAFIIWGFLLLVLAATGVGAVLYAIAIPFIALCTYDAGKLLHYVPDLFVFSICAVLIFYILNKVFSDE